MLDSRKLYFMAQGAERRKLLLQFLSLPENIEGIAVNNRYQFNTQYDKDLKLLLKKKLIKQKRVLRHNKNYKYSCKNQTYIVLAS